MIIDHHPDKRIASLYPEKKGIGYWIAIHKSLPPDPKGRGFEHWKSLTGDFPNPRNYVDANWNEADRKKTIGYLYSGRLVCKWRGQSYCNLCSRTIYLTSCLMDDKYIWPEWFIHYIEAHSVKPVYKFLEHAIYLPQSPMNTERYFNHKYFDSQLNVVVFECKARSNKEADELFKNETGVYPYKLPYVSSMVRMIDKDEQQ
jgi:hypothetical protein